MMAALTLTQDDFLALGRQLADAAIATYSQALAAHATTVNVPAPTAHPTIETIVRQYGGQYAVAPPITPLQVDQIGVLQGALIAKGILTQADLTAAAAMLAPSTPATSGATT
jgi:hypothetical protein